MLHLSVSQSGSLMRGNYTTGMLLGADDFCTEQDYLRQRIMRINRTLHGHGVASGLAVTVESKTGKRQKWWFRRASQSIAWARRSKFPLPVRAPLAATEKALLVQLRYAERPCAPVPIPGEAETAFSRAQKSFDVFLDATPDPNAVAHARLVRARGRWSVDKRFRRMVRSAGECSRSVPTTSPTD